MAGIETAYRSVPGALIREAREQICDVARRCSDRGLIVGPGGNFSVRVDDRYMVIKGTGVTAEQLVPEKCPVMGIVNGSLIHLDGEENVKPSCEWRVHLAAYRARPDISAIVHTHNPLATAFASTKIPMWPITPDFVAVLKEDEALPFIPYHTPTTNTLAMAIAQSLNGHQAVLMGKHGVFNVGSNIMEAFYRACLVEDSASSYLAMVQMSEAMGDHDWRMGVRRPSFALSLEDCRQLLGAGFEKERQAMLSGGAGGTIVTETGSIRRANFVEEPNLTAQLLAPGQMELTTLEFPFCGPDQLVARVNLAAICGSDLRLFSGTKAFNPGAILHEGTAEIVEVGKGFADTYFPGQRITLAAFNPRNHDAHFGYNGTGYSSRYFTIFPEYIEDGRVINIPPELSDMDAIMTEAFTCVTYGQNAVKKNLGNKFDHGRVVILGAGPIGNMHSIVAKANGASQIVLADPNTDRLELAKSKGIEADLVPVTQNIVPDIMRATQGHGGDVVILAVSKKEVAEQTFQYVANGGCIQFFAGVKKGDMIPLDPKKYTVYIGIGANAQLMADTSLDMYAVHYNNEVYTINELNEQGETTKTFYIVGSTASEPQDFVDVMQLTSQGKMDPTKVITHVISLDKLPAALGELSSGSGTCEGEPALKVVVDMNIPVKP